MLIFFNLKYITPLTNNEKDAIEAVIANIKLVTQRNAPTLFSENIEL